MPLFCSTNFPVLRRTRPDATCIVLPERCVFRQISSNTTTYSQNCVSPKLLKVARFCPLSKTVPLIKRSSLYNKTINYALNKNLLFFDNGERCTGRHQ